MRSYLLRSVLGVGLVGLIAYIDARSIPLSGVEVGYAWAWLAWAAPAAASLAKGILGSKAQEEATEANLQIARENNRLQFDEFVQRRVADAKAAGVSPLYAMGANASSPSPVSVQADFAAADAVGELGQNLGRWQASQMTKEQRELHMAQLGELQSRTRENDARAQLALQQAANLRQIDQSSPPPAVYRYEGGSGPVGRELEQDATKFTPDQVLSRNPNFPNVSAGRDDPSWKEFNIGGGFKMLAPRNEEGWSEGLESMPFYMIPAWVQANRKRYGDSWLDDFLLHAAGFDKGSGAHRGIERIRRGLEWIGRNLRNAF